MLKQEITKVLARALQSLGIETEEASVASIADGQKGDYTTNIALILAKQLKKNPLELAEEIKTALEKEKSTLLARIDVARPGFINFWVEEAKLMEEAFRPVLSEITQNALHGKKIFVEYAHPNTHKELHIGHMRTLITGEAIARLASAAGASVFRANYQGDIGLHVAKALYGITQMMAEKSLTMEQLSVWSNSEKAHFLGQGYARGSSDYEEKKEAIDQINKDLYAKDSATFKLYQTTRQWSLDYYDEFYKRFYTRFDNLFFESTVADAGVKIVTENIGKIFEKQNGAIVFPGEKYGLHTRVFITQAGNPTYEGKEMGNAYQEYDAFHFDKKIHVVGNEQVGYFQVVIKALELLDPEKFKDKQLHIAMGMVQFADRKMSSRTGDVLRVDWLIDQVKEKVAELMSGEKIAEDARDATIEQIAIGAIKYSVLQVGTGQNVAFDINKSVSLDGNSGPYIQYVYARTQSVLAKAGEHTIEKTPSVAVKPEERELARLLVQFPEVALDSAVRFAPNVITNYLFELAQSFNSFYQKCPILKAGEDERAFRLQLTAQTGEVIKKGLELLGIQAPKHM